MQYELKLPRYLFLTGLLLALSSCKNKVKIEMTEPEYVLIDSKDVPKFNADNAYKYIVKQLAFGPRTPNSIEHRYTLDFLSSELGKYADSTSLQKFSYPGYNNERLRLTNIAGHFNLNAEKRIMLCAHWDTRPRADEETDTKLREKPIPGANDGASGVGILLEIARILKSHKLNYGIDIVFFDGEDYGKKTDEMNFCLGSKYFSAEKIKHFNPSFAILLDMVGGKDAKFYKEYYSVQHAPQITEMIWKTAANVNAEKFFPKTGYPIYDDHIPLNLAGIKTVDIIDIDLVGNNDISRKYWHTLDDNIDKISKRTLSQVGSVITTFIFSLKFN